MTVMGIEDKTYSGWANYSTWNVNMLLSNDEGLYLQIREQVKEIRDYTSAREPMTREETVRWEVAETLKNLVTDDLAPDLGASFAADLLGYALEEVNWFEIADSWIEDAKED